MEIIISEEEREVYFCLECFEGDEKELKNVLAHKDNQGREKEREEELWSRKRELSRRRISIMEERRLWEKENRYNPDWEWRFEKLLEFHERELEVVKEGLEFVKEWEDFAMSASTGNWTDSEYRREKLEFIKIEEKFWNEGWRVCEANVENCKEGFLNIRKENEAKKRQEEEKKRREEGREMLFWLPLQIMGGVINEWRKIEIFGFYPFWFFISIMVLGIGGKLLSGWGSGFNIWERRVHNNKAGGKIRFTNKI